MKKQKTDKTFGYCEDVQKILSSNSFARIHDKTQVVYLLPHDHITNRSLHVQLVSFFARSVGREMGLNCDLIEAIALGHDLGHPPFGHEGEMYLSKISEERGFGSFSHAMQSCRLAEYIEPLHLSIEVLDGFLCHDGGLQERSIEVHEPTRKAEYSKKKALRKKDAEINLIPMTDEGTLVKLSDTISYVARDIEDALVLHLITPEEVPETSFGLHYRDFVRLTREDLLSNKKKTGKVFLSKHVHDELKTLREFNFQRIYCHHTLKSESPKIERAYRLLFDLLLSNWEKKGKSSILWTHFLHSKNPSYVEESPPFILARDFIAGMTDGYFLRLFEGLFIPSMIQVPNVLSFC